ncbi:MAG: glycosyltransferase family 4 protein [Isosphaeraceae bacterium]|nr:glycosyltransferase family 4 protein [Isosphaeraceae bacterium]
MSTHPTLRVLHCSAGNLHGGVETVLNTLARQRALNPRLAPEFALGFEGRSSAELRAAGATVHVLGPARVSRPWTFWSTRRRLRQLLAARPIDVVVSHGCWPHMLFGPAARQYGRPLVYWMHDLAQGTHWIDRRAARTSPDLALANSQCTAEALPRLFPRAPRAVFYCPVSPPTVDPAEARAPIRDELATPPSVTVILQSSRLERWKGHALLLAALGQLRDRPNWVAWIAGGAQRPSEQAYRDELIATANEAGIADRVRFLGQRSDVPRLLAAADIHCQPNTGPEPFGIAFIEALYAGRPVVSTRLGGAAEIVDDTCGILVPPGDANTLAEALTRLIDDPDARARLGAGGPARARQLCDPAEALTRLESLLRSACAKGAR